MPKPKYPKSMGACADMLFDMKEKRLAADKAAAELKAEESALTEHIINNLPKGDTGASGKHHKVQVVTKQVPQLDPEQSEAFYKWVSKNKRWDALQRRLNEKAIADTLDAGKQVPGIKMFTAVKLSLTKV